MNPLWNIAVNGPVKSPIQNYRQLNVQTSVDQASPHQLIDMLFTGMQDRLNQARGFVQHDDIEGRSVAINACIEIVGGLQASLDHDAGGEIAENLDSLYDYMQRRLFRANADNDMNALNEVGDLLQTLRSAWVSIEPQVSVSAG